ncbi:Uncharacterised protein [Mycobacteroides abscessus subsp. abscessus]|nr:Uncharacterised protein [Mycobacteroides abscessus subsp. abscessus]
MGHNFRSNSRGTAKKLLSGGICDACARSAASRASKKSAHGTRVVTRRSKVSSSAGQRSSHSSNGPLYPCFLHSSLSNCIRARMNPWL